VCPTVQISQIHTRTTQISQIPMKDTDLVDLATWSVRRPLAKPALSYSAGLARDGGQGLFAMDSVRRSTGQLMADLTWSGGVDEEARGGGSSMEWSAYTALAHATLAVGSTARKAAAAVWAGGHRGSTTPPFVFSIHLQRRT
jgi:hypothetical protein